MPHHSDLRPLQSAASPTLVGFADRHTLNARGGMAIGGLLTAWAIVGVSLVVWIVLTILLHAMGFSAPSPLIAIVVAAAAVGVVAISHRRGFWRPAVTAANKAVLPNESMRVWCVLPWYQRETLLDLGPLDDVAFEPEVFPAPFAAKPTQPMYAGWIAATAAVFGALYFGIRSTPTVPIPATNIMVLYGALALGWVVVAAAWPTTIRIVPGRLDIMRGWFLSSRRPVIATINLRDTRVVLDLQSGVLFANGPAKDLQSDAAVALGPSKFQVAHTILRAAVSTAEPSPLPDAEVVG